MQHSSTTLPIILTGDRTTGPLHLGHYVGSLKNRVTLQTTHQQYLLLADTQALTDNAHNPGRLRDNILEIAPDYLAVGMSRSTPRSVFNCIVRGGRIDPCEHALVTWRGCSRPNHQGRNSGARFRQRYSCRLSLLSRRPGRRHHRFQSDHCPGWGRSSSIDRTNQ